MTYVRVNSHRAREKLNRLLGTAPKSFYNLAASYHLYEIPQDKLEAVLRIKGILKSKMKSIKLNGYTYEFHETINLRII